MKWRNNNEQQSVQYSKFDFGSFKYSHTSDPLNQGRLPIRGLKKGLRVCPGFEVEVNPSLKCNHECLILLNIFVEIFKMILYPDCFAYLLQGHI